MFITFEGIDFSGKSTQVKLLSDYLISINKKVEIIREPGGTFISEKVRELLLDKRNENLSIETEIFLFSSSRAQLVKEKITPLLQKGYYVISDRFHDSTTAYQGYGRGIPLDAVKQINKLAIGSTIPDLSFFIDIPVAIALERKAKKTFVSLDRIEMSDEAFFKKVREGYMEIVKKEKRFRVIDGTFNVQEIHKKIIDDVNKFSHINSVASQEGIKNEK